MRAGHAPQPLGLRIEETHEFNALYFHSLNSFLAKNGDTEIFINVTNEIVDDLNNITNVYDGESLLNRFAKVHGHPAHQGGREDLVDAVLSAELLQADDHASNARFSSLVAVAAIRFVQTGSRGCARLARDYAVIVVFQQN